MSALYFECPVTGHRVATGIEIDHDSFDSLPPVRDAGRCPYCRKPHLLSEVWGWVEDGDTPSKWPFGEAGG
jgi:hypothetical protein